MKTCYSILLVLFANLIYAQGKVPEIDKLIDSLYNTNSFNGNILIAEKGNVIYNKSFGLANVQTK